MLVGQLLDHLREIDLYDDALIVVTADHGASFDVGTHRRRAETETLDRILPVPLFVKYPGQSDGGPDDRTVETIDIVPTIADVVGAPVPWGLDGTSLVADGASREDRQIYDHGETYDVPGGPVPGVADSVARVYERFGAGDGSLSLYDLGPAPGLVGRAAAALARGEASSGCWEPGSGSVAGGRGWVAGEIRGAAATPVAYAVVVDGTVAASSWSFSSDDADAEVYAVADPEVWPARGGEVELFLIDDSATPAGSSRPLRGLPACSEADPR